MKKLFFSFVMLVMLVIVAGSAKGQTKTTPFRGSTYSYSLGGIVVNTAGSAAITYSTPGDVNIKNIVGASVTAGSAQVLTFDIEYKTTATLGAQKITVTVTDGGGCTNFIYLNVDVKDVPTIDLALSVDAFDCQNLGIPGNNESAAVATNGTPPAINDIIYTVTPDIKNVGSSNYTYGYKLTIPTASAATALTDYAVTYTGPGSVNTATPGEITISGISQTDLLTKGEFKVTFKTTTGIAPVTIAPVLSNAALTLSVANGGGKYDASYTPATASETVPTVPTIGGTIQ